MKSVEDVRLDRLKAIKAQNKWNVQQLADAVAKSHSQVSQLLTKAKHSKTGKPRVIGSDLARQFEKSLGLPEGWFDTPFENPVTDPGTPRGVAHLVSLSDLRVPPTKLEWGAIEMDKEYLPQEFQVAVPDDALAPKVRAGWLIQCDTREAPRFGDRVIVRDSLGRCHFRLYQQGIGDGWEAAATAEGFRTLKPETDGVTVVAVVMHTLQPRGA